MESARRLRFLILFPSETTAPTTFYYKSTNEESFAWSLMLHFFPLWVCFPLNDPQNEMKGLFKNAVSENYESLGVSWELISQVENKLLGLKIISKSGVCLILCKFNNYAATIFFSLNVIKITLSSKPH